MIAILILIWLCSGLIVAGWYVAYAQGDTRRSYPSLADELYREDLGFGIIFGFMFGSLGPIGILLAWLLSGFAKYGWSLRKKV